MVAIGVTVEETISTSSLEMGGFLQLFGGWLWSGSGRGDVEVVRPVQRQLEEEGASRAPTIGSHPHETLVQQL